MFGKQTGGPTRAEEKADDFDTTFSMLVKGCREVAEEGFLEAPIYNNAQIEAAWLFLFEVRRRHVNKRKQLQECIRTLGSSYNWSMARFGSRKVQDALRALPGSSAALLHLEPVLPHRNM